MKSRTYMQYLKLMKRFTRESAAREVMLPESRVKKEGIVKELASLISNYRTIGLIGLEGIPSTQFKELKKLLSKYGVVRVAKNSLVIKALKEVRPKNYEELVKILTGPNAFIFTNLNAFELALLCDKIKSRRYAKPGDVASSEILLPSGPTDIPPGPMLSVFGKLKVPTQVREGVIWVAKDTTVARPGDVISPELASLLRKLDIKPIDVKLRIKAVYDSGYVFKAEELRLNIDEFKADIITALKSSITLASEAALPIPEVLPLILTKAYLSSLGLATEVGVVTPENVSYVLSKALMNALAVASVLKNKVPDLGIELQIPTQAVKTQPQPVAEEAKEEGKEEKKEVSEEDLAAGLSSLFG